MSRIMKHIGSWLPTAASIALLAATASAQEGHGKAAATDVIRSAASGAWSQATTWEGGQVPAAGAGADPPEPYGDVRREG